LLKHLLCRRPQSHTTQLPNAPSSHQHSFLAVVHFLFSPTPSCPLTFHHQPHYHNGTRRLQRPHRCWSRWVQQPRRRWSRWVQRSHRCRPRWVQWARGLRSRRVQLKTGPFMCLLSRPRKAWGLSVRTCSLKDVVQTARPSKTPSFSDTKPVPTHTHISQSFQHSGGVSQSFFQSKRHFQRRSFSAFFTQHQRQRHHHHLQKKSSALGAQNQLGQDPSGQVTLQPFPDFRQSA